MLYIILDYVTALVVIASLLLTSKYKKAWLLYSASSLPYMAVTLHKGLLGLTLMGAVLGCVGIYNYVIQARKRTINISMYGGKKYIDLLNIMPEDLDINKIAKSLSHICRYGGRSSKFYSVAEHCYHVSCLAPAYNVDPGCALLHDAAEAYIGDIISTYKPGTVVFGHPIQQIEKKIMSRIWSVLYPEAKFMDEGMVERLHQLDLDIRTAEAKQLHIHLTPGPRGAEELVDGLYLPIIGMSPKHAEKAFLTKAKEWDII